MNNSHYTLCYSVSSVVNITIYISQFSDTATSA